MIYVCPEKDRAVQRPCEHCTCGMDKLPEFQRGAVKPCPPTELWPAPVKSE